MAAFAEFESLNGEDLKRARNAFYTERNAKLSELFTEKQMALWTEFWVTR